MKGDLTLCNDRMMDSYQEFQEVEHANQLINYSIYQTSVVSMTKILLTIYQLTICKGQSTALNLNRQYNLLIKYI